MLTLGVSLSVNSIDSFHRNLLLGLNAINNSNSVHNKLINIYRWGKQSINNNTNLRFIDNIDSFTYYSPSLVFQPEREKKSTYNIS